MLMLQAYDADPSSPVVLNMLAHHSLLRGDADKVVQLAEAALKAAESDAIRCESLTLLARAKHARGELNAALRGYRQVLVLTLALSETLTLTLILGGPDADLKLIMSSPLTIHWQPSRRGTTGLQLALVSG